MKTHPTHPIGTHRAAPDRARSRPAAAGVAHQLPGHSAPGVGFEVPLEMLSACHGRVEQQCATLRRLVPHLLAHGADEQARVAAARVIRYFDTSGRDHHADEEVDLFPALIASAPEPDAVAIRALTAALTAEHRELETRWRHLKAVLERVAAGDSVALESADVESLAGLYEQHIAREEAELLPIAGRQLSESSLDRVGRAMRERRGIAAVR